MMRGAGFFPFTAFSRTPQVLYRIFTGAYRWYRAEKNGTIFLKKLCPTIKRNADKTHRGKKPGAAFTAPDFVLCKKNFR
ncbi:MAG: hypothetical protein P1P63_09440 [Treponemataceae bacterium]